MALTRSWTSLISSTTARASDVQGMLNYTSEDIVPHLSGAQASNTYKLGTTTAKWLNLYADKVTISTGTSSFLGNVGVGTDAPANALEVKVSDASNGAALNGSQIIINQDGAGDASLEFNAGALAYSILNDNSDNDIFKLRDITNSYTFLEYNPTNQDVIFEAGSVGIGTATPATLLNIFSTSSPTFTISNNASTGAGIIRFDNGGTNYGLGNKANIKANITNSTTGATSLSFETSLGDLTTPSTKMTIDSAGNVGIGTTATTFYDYGNLAGTSYNQKLSIEPATDEYIGFSGNATNDTTSINFATKNAVGSRDIISRIMAVTSSKTNTVESGYLTFYTKSGTLNTAAEERVRIDKDGNVGIGTSAPDSNLEVASPIGAILQLSSTDTSLDANDVLGEIDFYSSDTSSLCEGVMAKIVGYTKGTGSQIGNLGFYTRSYVGLNYDERITIQYDGNVGVGTTSPLNTFIDLTASYSGLHVAGVNSRVICEGTGSAQIDLYESTGTVNQKWTLFQHNADFTYLYALNDAATLKHTFLACDHDSGNVGIGITSSLGARLHIVDTTEQLRIGYDSANYSKFEVASDGSLTITSTVSGGITFASNVSAQGNVDIDEFTTLGSGNTAIKVKTIDIGAWDMDTVDSVQFTHGLTHTKIRSIVATIRNDDGSINQMLTSDNGGIIRYGSTYVTLLRLGGGYFDGTDFDYTTGSYNRGWIVITYVE